MSKRLVLFVEGRGDIRAVPSLAQKVLTHLNGDDALYLDGEPFRSDHTNKAIKDWPRKLNAAMATRRDIGAILLVLDGDADHLVEDEYVRRNGVEPFCPRKAAAYFAEIARMECTGRGVSVAIVFAMKEMECWAVSVIDHLGGTDLSDGTLIPNNLEPPISADGIRDAKGWIEGVIGRKYKPSQHQQALVRNLPIQVTMERSRSFKRFVHAIEELILAMRNGQPIATPV